MPKFLYTSLSLRVSCQYVIPRNYNAKNFKVVNGTISSPRTRSLQDYQCEVLQRPAIATVAGMYYRKGIAELIDAFFQMGDANTHLFPS
ncbi:MAG: hypothetical protein KME01_08330 [Chroococcus sp. CMT-3BRIN-NPC107]|nr:hypothetical protein [Chroococcus sp. CMT-3BRIN-NPC107]